MSRVLTSSPPRRGTRAADASPAPLQVPAQLPPHLRAHADAHQHRHAPTQRRAPSAVAARAAAGFTLVEVLLATVLLAAGLALAFATLRSANVVTQRGEQLSQRSERMRSVEGFLRRRIASALPIAFSKDPQTSMPIRFVGEPQRMRFVADLPDYLGRGGPSLHDVQLVEANGGGQQLAVSFLTVVGGAAVEPREPRAPEPLVPDLTEVRFRYRGMDAQNKLADWADTWPTSERLPLLVSVEIVSKSAGRWPPLVIALPQGAADPALTNERGFR